MSNAHESLEIKRFLVAFVSMACGGIFTAAEIAIGYRFLPPPNAGPAWHRELEERLLIVGASVTCFVVAYRVAKWLYKLMNAQQELLELETLSKGHLAILHVMSAGYLINATVCGVQVGGFVHPSMFVGVVLLGFALWDLFWVWREQRLQLTIAKRS